MEYLHPGFLDYWFAPGAWAHLHVPGVTEGRGICLKLIPRVTPLNAGNLRCKRAHMERKVDLEKPTTPHPPKKTNPCFDFVVEAKVLKGPILY